MEAGSRSNDMRAEVQTVPAGHYANAAPPGHQYSNPLDRFWNLYLIDAERADKKLTDGWKGDTDGILIFTGLFATTIASFIIAVFPTLSPDSSADTVALLKQIAQQQTSGLNGSQSTITLPSDTFKVTSSALRVNILWILSFFLSLCCALAATLVQQWTRQYLADSQPRGAPSKRGPVHAYLRVGIDRFGFAGCVDFIVTLLHVSVFLFMGGLLEFAFSLNLALAYSLLGLTIVGVTAYIVLTVLPVLYSDCPYKTPLTPVIRTLKIWYRSSCIYILRWLQDTFRSRSPPPFWWIGSKDNWDVVKAGYRSTRRHVWEIRTRAYTLSNLSQAIAFQRPAHVFSQMAQNLDEDLERYQYLVTLPSFFESLSKLHYPVKPLLEARDWYGPLNGIIMSYWQTMNPGSPSLDTLPLENLVVLACSLLKPHQYEFVDTRFLHLDGEIGVCDWDWQTDSPGSSSLRTIMNYPARSCRMLLLHKDPVVSFLSFCCVLSAELIYPPASSILDYNFPLDNHAQYEISVGNSFTALRCVDKLLLSLLRTSLKMANLYRLLFFIRAVLHYSTAPGMLLRSYAHIWLQVLYGLHVLAFESDLRLLPDEARFCVYEIVSVIGRDDLLPRSNLGLHPNTRRHDYGVVFEAHPALGGCLRSVITAIGLPTMYRHRPRHHASAPRLGPGRHLREGVRYIDRGERYERAGLTRYEQIQSSDGRVSRASM